MVKTIIRVRVVKYKTENIKMHIELNFYLFELKLFDQDYII